MSDKTEKNNAKETNSKKTPKANLIVDSKEQTNDELKKEKVLKATQLKSAQTDQDVERLKAKEFKDTSSNTNNINADLVADKSSGHIAKNLATPESGTLDNDVENDNNNFIAQGVVENNDLTEKPVLTAKLASELIPESATELAVDVTNPSTFTRIGKGGGVTTPAGASFSLNAGLAKSTVTNHHPLVGVLAERTESPELIGNQDHQGLPSAISGKIPTSVNVPNQVPVVAPGQIPTAIPSQVPTLTPDQIPTAIPSQVPTLTPDQIPTAIPNQVPTLTPGQVPTPIPNQVPTLTPGQIPTAIPNQVPTLTPGQIPTAIPNQVPTLTPGQIPTAIPNQVPMSASISVNAITQDNIVNAIESKTDIEITGAVSGNVTDGDLVTLEINGKSFSGAVLSGKFSIIVPGSDLAVDTNVHATLVATNSLGHNLTRTDEQSYQVDTKVSATDDLNTAIEGQSQTATSGNVLTNDDHDGTKVITTDVTGAYGTYHFKADGSYTYQLDNTISQALTAGQVEQDHATYEITDAAGNKTSATLTTIITGTNDKAVITGQDISSLTEDVNATAVNTLKGVTPIHQGIATHGQLTVIDPDASEAHFVGQQTTIGHGTFILSENGYWNYTVDNSSNAVQSLGAGQSITDTIIVTSTDGTTHDIVVTIHGTNDAPHCSSEVQLSSGTEDTTINFTAAQLLANSSDIDANDFNQLYVDSITVNHGVVNHNSDGSFTFTPEKGYNGQVHFSYDVKDAHGGVTHTGATSTLVAVQDNAIISGVDTGSVTENTAGKDMSPDQAHAGMSHLTGAMLYADGKLNISDPDTGENEFDTNQGGGQGYGYTYHGAYGHLVLNADGQWHYNVNAGNQHNGEMPGSVGTAIDKLGVGESLTDTITVRAKDGTEHNIVITIHGSNDRPYCSSDVQLTPGAEDTRQTLTTAQLLANTVDVDKNDAGLLSIENLHADHGSILTHADGTYTFTPEKDYNGTVHFSYDVKDAHGGVTHTGASTTLSVVGDAAVIGGVDTGSVDEGHAGINMSPDYAQPGMSNLGQSALSVDGKLTISDADKGEAEFDPKSGDFTSYSGRYGHLLLNTDGNWHYLVTVGTSDYVGNAPSKVGSVIDQLGEGQSLTDTVTVFSKDGTSHDIVITIHGDNDRPYCSSEVQLNAGTEDTRQTITVAQLLTNTVDVDNNDIGLLTIENLQPDHGSIAINSDGSFSFTPEQDYNGQVHFTYDVKDAHGGISHTGATTSLAAVDEHTIFGGIDTAIAKEDVDPGVSSYGNFGGNSYSMSQWHQLTITDTDNKVDHVNIEFGGNTYSWQVGTPIDINTQYGKFELITVASGAHKGELAWLYNGDNTNVSIQGLKEGESLSESITLVAPDGTRQSLSIEIKGTEDHVIIDSPAHLGDVIEHLATGAQVNGQLQAHDIDTHDSVSWAVTQTAGKYGAFSIDANGQWQYVVDEAKAASLGDGQEWNEHFTVEALSTDGSQISKTVSVAVHGSNNAPTVTSGLVLTQGNEGTQIILTQQDLLAHASDADNNDRGWLRVHNLTADHGTINTNTDGSFTFTPDKDYNGQVHFNYDVKDAHGGVTHTGASTSLAAVNHSPDVTPLTDTVNEGTDNHHSINLLLGATDKEGDALTVSHLEYAIDGQPQSGQLPTGITLGADGNTLVVDSTDAAFNHLAIGQSQKVAITYQVEDGHGGSAQQTAMLTIEGTDDKATLVSNVIQLSETQALDSEFTTYKGNLQLIDPDSGENSQFIFSGKYLGQGYAPASLYVWPDGSYQFRLEGASNRHADDLISSLHTGESMEIPYEIKTNDGQKITIMVKVIGEDNQARIEVGRYSSVDNHAYEDNLSPGSTPNQIYSGGNLHVIDPDHSQAGFIAQHITTTEGGIFFINPRGNWAYTIDNAKVQHLGAGESFQKTFTVDSIDGSAHQNITVTVHGTNDVPIVSAQIQIAQGSEDTNIQLHAVDLLANATDVDHNDVGQLSIANLVANHGDIIDNKDGTFTFHPDHNYNGQVHFSYDVTDMHGGITHAGANTSLTAVNDAAIISGDTTATVYERDVDATGEVFSTGQLSATDVDNPDNDFQAGYVVHSPNGKDTNLGTLHIEANGKWTYEAGAIALGTINNGDTHLDKFEIKTNDGTTHEVDIMVVGGNHGLVAQIHAPTLGSVTPTPIIQTQHTPVTAAISIDDITADNIVNSTEAQHQVHVTGTVGGDVKDGDTVSLMVDGHGYSGLAKGGLFDVLVDGADLAASNKILAEVTAKTLTGDTQTASSEHIYAVDIKAPALPIIQAAHQTGASAITIQSNLHDGNFALDSSGSHSHHSPYGTAHIDPDTGTVTFSPIMTGNPHTKHHGEFEVFQHGQHVANIEVDSWNHNRHPAEISVNPLSTGNIQHDEPEQEAPVDSPKNIEVTGLLEDPVDHYLAMIGINKDDLPTTEHPVFSGDILARVGTHSNDVNGDPLVDETSFDPFENPLDDDKNHHDLTVLDDNQNDQSLIEPLNNNDDDSLHQALNDMHSQF